MSEKPEARCRKGRLIFRRYRRCPKTGKVLDARHYGLKAWPIHLGEDE